MKDHGLDLAVIGNGRTAALVDPCSRIVRSGICSEIAFNAAALWPGSLKRTAKTLGGPRRRSASTSLDMPWPTPSSESVLRSPPIARDRSRRFRSAARRRC